MRYLINTALTCRLSQKWRRHGYCHLKRGEIMPDIINSVKEEFINEYIRKIDTAIETYNATIGSNDEIFDLVIEISNVFENDIPNLQTSVLIRTGTEIRDANIVRAMLIKYLADNGIEYKGKGIEENVKEKRFWNSFIHWFETELPGLELLDGKYLRWDNWDGGMWFIELDYDHEFTLYRGTVYPSPLKTTMLEKMTQDNPKLKAYREGDFSPVELAWCAYVSHSQYEIIIKKYANLAGEIKKNTVKEGEMYIITYTRIITDIPDFHKELEQYEIYNGLKSKAEFEEIVLSRFTSWSEDNQLFECSIFQNIIENQILYLQMNDDEIVDFYRRVKDTLKGKKYKIIYLSVDNVREAEEIIKKERSDEAGNEMWFPVMIKYLEGAPFFKAHQLQKKGKHGYYIEETKTDSGTRVLPMSADVEECFKRIIENRNPPKIEPMVDGRSGFLFFDKDGSISYSLHWEHYFKHALDKYNGIYKVQLPTITSHVCRHTYCTNMAKSGMNPKALQYLMGHSDISVTLNVYTHVKFEDAKAEIERIANV